MIEGDDYSQLDILISIANRHARHRYHNQTSHKMALAMRPVVSAPLGAYT
jgi:hypothetical protein